LSAVYAWVILFPSVLDGPFLGIGPYTDEGQTGTGSTEKP
jgi:hypothetical protein